MSAGLRRWRTRGAPIFIIIGCAATIFIFSRYSTPVAVLSARSEPYQDKVLLHFDLQHVHLEIQQIHFAETSGEKELNLRQACSVESAALHHPDKVVTLHSIVPMSQNSPLHKMLLSKPNIKFEVLNLTQLFSNTPMEEWNRSDKISKSQHPIEHLSDGVRIALLWRHGGIYLDTDVFTVRPINDLRNALGLEFPDVANGAILVFDQRHPFIYQCMVDYVAKYSNDVWAMQGPLLLTRNLQRVCGMTGISAAVNHPELCQGVTILPIPSFFPITYNQLDKLFSSALNNKSNIFGAYTVHLWNNLTWKKVVKPGNGTFLETLAKENCPSTYQIMLQRNMI